ncbi:dTDP-glucose 4,6-dehydratase [Tistrella bauzanensis]|uniref:dTDP-glucose 4,6-dehydratase n=1 Tax=Tistrella bauzanensis TaxID=657419 RepID=A0ABQ1IS72_9PROT|nr:dTDP-glucose 4,6-dehydratase [Tistrella bauzanensis]GGB47999.1 dTDP-glucose 4,6-dehydratase [Tistrella bauzanensis]
MPKIVITGGAGFIGSHITDHICEQFPDYDVVVFDKMTYAADIRNIQHLVANERIELVVGDICDFDLACRVVDGADYVVHAAAESHVDNSFGNSLLFTMTNVYGTHAMMEACRRMGVKRIVHVSTDEVYGEVLDGAADESTVLNPTNPYSASKAGAEMIISGYLHSYRMPIVTVRGNNIYGIRQYPEKIIPRFSLLLECGKKLTIHGAGNNRRHFLAAEDFAAAIVLLMRKGEIGEIYNIGSEDEFENIIVAGMIAQTFGYALDDVVEYVPDRPFNDRRYAIDSRKIRELGWAPERHLLDDLPRVVGWYRENAPRFRRLMATFEGHGSDIDLDLRAITHSA